MSLHCGYLSFLSIITIIYVCHQYVAVTNIIGQSHNSAMHVLVLYIKVDIDNVYFLI